MPMPMTRTYSQSIANSARDRPAIRSGNVRAHIAKQNQARFNAFGGGYASNGNAVFVPSNQEGEPLPCWVDIRISFVDY